MTIKQSADYLQMSVRSVHRYLEKGLIPQRGIEGTVRLDKRDLDALILYGRPWKKLITRQKDEIKAMDL
ncbi:MAG: helix-turn-helix domain-containing protein [Actinobacteria bacterium]|nr:helix-turn-helix domain-containing protein [Actinomycetota bacterium]